jgi:hypothetical protein
VSHPTCCPRCDSLRVVAAIPASPEVPQYACQRCHFTWGGQLPALSRLASQREPCPKCASTDLRFVEHTAQTAIYSCGCCQQAIALSL